jgi:hypothetical protein
MTHDITMPPEAVEAARKAFTEAMLTVPQPDPITAACRAMLNAWPAWAISPYAPVEIGKDYIILPLPPKNGDT